MSFDMKKMLNEIEKHKQKSIWQILTSRFNDCFRPSKDSTAKQLRKIRKEAWYYENMNWTLKRQLSQLITHLCSLETGKKLKECLVYDLIMKHYPNYCHKEDDEDEDEDDM